MAKGKPKSYCEFVEHLEESNVHRIYHDNQYGFPIDSDKELFGRLVLEINQAGLSWTTILNKRENYREAFDNFIPEKIAQYTERDVKRLLANSGIVRNRLKILAAINNAKKFLEVRKEFGSFDKYIWQFVNYKTIKNAFRTPKQLPVQTSESEAMTRDLKKRGFKFVGATICYAFMQAVGMVNDHTADCFRYDELNRKR